jgi:hypothetical protein
LADQKRVFGVGIVFGAFQRLNLGLAVAAALAVATGCTMPDTAGNRHAQEDAEPAPVQVPMTAQQERDRAEARQAYVSCLRQAAQYIGDKGGATGDQTSAVAPLCYAQFTRFEDAATVSMSTRDKRAFDRAGDKQQLDFASDAIRQLHGLAALTPDK